MTACCLPKRTLAILGVFLAVLFHTEIGFSGYVKGYYRKNGTYVAPHYRRDRGSSSTYKPSTSTYRRSSSTTYTPSSSTYSSGSSTSSSGSKMSHSFGSTAVAGSGAVTSETKNISSEEQATNERLSQIDQAIVSYKAKNEGKLPQTLLTLWRSTSTMLLISDGWGSRFNYKVEGEGYLLSSNGPDKKSGTFDDIYSENSSGAISTK